MSGQTKPDPFKHSYAQLQKNRSGSTQLSENATKSGAMQTNPTAQIESRKKIQNLESRETLHQIEEIHTQLLLLKK